MLQCTLFERGGGLLQDWFVSSGWTAYSWPSCVTWTERVRLRHPLIVRLSISPAFWNKSLMCNKKYDIKFDSSASAKVIAYEGANIASEKYFKPWSFIYLMKELTVCLKKYISTYMLNKTLSPTTTMVFEPLIPLCAKNHCKSFLNIHLVHMPLFQNSDAHGKNEKNTRQLSMHRLCNMLASKSSVEVVFGIICR